jgi:hypothetical protein
VDLIQAAFAQIMLKTRKSLQYLGLDSKMASVYIASKYWASDVDNAKHLGFGVIVENGCDLDVSGPIKPLMVLNGDVVNAKKRGRKAKSS